MSEVIVRMKKVPKNCDDSCWGYLSSECPWSDHVDGYTMDGGRPRNCPIKGVLPEEHGRLIDADDVNNHIIGYVDLRDCPTIVEAAERKDNETTAD